MGKLTDEQQAIVQHPMGKHARVLAVAGSGKTATMVARIKYLVEEQGIDQQMIDVYMFNADAADHFREKLFQEMPGQIWKGNVHTFHAVALEIIRKGIEHKTIVPYREEWLGDVGTSIQKRYLRSIIKSMVHNGDAAEGALTAEEALRMIGLWKSSMITPKDADCEATAQYVQVYEEFERKRREVPALTFDDFVPVAVNILNNDPELLAGEVSRRAFMIIDEYQDINEGQQRLMKLLAGDRSDVMVVGDDDQTIYEWRGAQPEYILSGFDRDFANKPVMVYPLSRSFRFGPLLAQSAYNVITENSVRATKELVAHKLEAVTEISIIDAEESGSQSPDSQLAQRMSSLLGVDQVSAQEVMTLGRTYAQMEPLEAECLKAHVPFVVPKRGPFFARAENLVLIDYMRLALSLDMKVGDVAPSYQRSGRIASSSGDCRGGEATEMVLSTINAPRRYVARDDAKQAVLEGSKMGWTIRATLEWLGGPESPCEREQARFQAGDYLKLLVRIVEHIEQHPGISAGTLMSWILDTSGYTKNPPNAPADDEDNPDDLEASIGNFLDYAKQTRLAPAEFIDYLSTLDTMCGKPEEECVVFTSIHRAKGLEADYIFLPGCNDGVMPIHLGGGPEADLLRDFEVDAAEAPNDHMESERRLFYVAVTRAKRQLYIGTGGVAGLSRSPFLAEMQLEPTRTAVDAFLGVLRSKTRDMNDALWRIFVGACVGPFPNGKVAQYARNHYIDQLDNPLLRKRVDDAIAQASADDAAADVAGSVVTVMAAPVRGTTSDRPGQPWWKAFIRGPDEHWKSKAEPMTESHGSSMDELPDEFYHVTRISNLPSIFVAGLLCWRDASRIRDISPFPDGVVHRRSDPIDTTHDVDTGYVALSLCTHSPFLHMVTREHDWHNLDTGAKRSDGSHPDDEVVILTLDARRVIQLPGTIYTNLDVCNPSASFYEAREFPAHVDLSAIRRSGRTDDSAVAARAATVLVPGAIPAMLITSITVYSEAALRRAKDGIWERLARHEDDTHELPRCMSLLEVEPEAFFAP